MYIYTLLFSFSTMAKGKFRRRKTNFATRVKKVLAQQQEHKLHVVSGSFDSIPTGGIIGHLSTVGQGDTDGTRDGDQLSVTKFEIRGMVKTADATNNVRIIVFRWNGDSTPSTTDIVQNFQGTGTDLDFLRPINHDHKKNIKILYDRWFRLSTSEAFMSDIPFRVVRYGKRLGAKKITYENGTTTPLKGGIWMMAFSDSGAISHPGVSYEGMVHFTDS